MLAGVRALFTTAWLVLLCSCDTSAPPVEPPKPREESAEVAEKQPKLQAAPRLDSPSTAEPSPSAPLPEARNHARPPKDGCVLRHEQALSNDAERAVAASLSGAPIVIVLEEKGSTLALWTSTAAGFTRAFSAPLEAKAQRASAACSGVRCELAIVDVRARLLGLQLTSKGFSSPRVLASGLDRRFAPALVDTGTRVLYAYTANVDKAMHTFWLESKAGKLSIPVDLTPRAHGAAAPSFVLGSKLPTLVALDPWAGMSPLLELSFGVAGPPSAAVVRTPVSQPYEPPLLAAVEWASGEVEVAYTAVGRLAMTAIGRVPLRKASEPTALSPSKGYGELSFAAARSGARALFAIEVAVDTKPDAPREISLKLLDGVSTVQGPTFAADARHPSVTRLREPGEYLVTYARANTVQAALVGCQDP
ncbi:MAG: hypothetical protein RLZZ450_2305 [Pseudomonadota bacterium]|jgi:hypothetical protein